MTGEIPLSEQLLGKAREFSAQAGNKNLVGKKAIKSASVTIGTMLAQMDPESARQEYFRIQKNALLAAVQIAKEKGPAKAAEYLLGHAVAASTLKDFATAESSLDPNKLNSLAKTIKQEVEEKLG